MDLNPFAPPRTTEPDGDAGPAAGSPRTLDEDALRALVGAGRWATWAARMGWVSAVLALVRLARINVEPGSGSDIGRKVGTSALILLASVVLSTLSGKFGRAATRLPADRAALDRAMKNQRRWAAISGIAVTAMATIVLIAVVAILLRARA